MDRERLKGNLDLLLLSVLAVGPGHGYAIITRLKERSDGAFDLPEKFNRLTGNRGPLVLAARGRARAGRRGGGPGDGA